MPLRVPLLCALALVGVLAACGEEDPPAGDAGHYAPVGASFCRDIDATALFEDAAPQVTWTSGPAEVVDGVDPVVCTFEGTSTEPAGIQNLGPDPGVYLTVEVAEDVAAARVCYEAALEDLADAQAPATGGSAPAAVDGWWDEGQRQQEVQASDSGLPDGQAPAEVGRSSVKYVVRDDNLCATARVADQAFDALETDTRIDRGDHLLDALMARLQELLETD